MTDITEKKCGGCKQTKPLTEFTKDKRRDDGLTFYCKDCHKLRMCGLGSMIDSSKKPVSEKRCFGCKLVKPVIEFCKSKIHKDGLNHYCKDCARKQRQERAQRNRPAVGPRSYAAILCTWKQVNEVLGELCELETSRIAEIAERNRKILLAKAGADRHFNRIHNRERELFGLLDSFAETYIAENLVTKALSFGRVRIDKGQIDVELDRDHACKEGGNNEKA